MNRIPYLQLTIMSLILPTIVWILLILVGVFSQGGCVPFLGGDIPALCSFDYFWGIFATLMLFSLGLAYIVPAAIIFLFGWIYYRWKIRTKS